MENAVIRNATLDDTTALTELIHISARVLGRAFYSDVQIEAALGSAWGVDTQLIKDGTYFVVDKTGQIAGCGGWSRRKTLFGGDAQAGRESAPLDKTTDAARIRAFFVRPEFAREGIATRLLEKCEAEARRDGFRSMELVATLPGERFYSRFGYTQTERLAHVLRPGLTIPFVRMRKAAL